MNTDLRVLVIGAQDSGKSTYGQHLAKALGTECHDTSEWLVEIESFRQRVLMERYGITPWMMKGLPPKPQNPDGTWDLEEGFTTVWGRDDLRDRPARELLVALGDAVCTTNPGFLVERCWDKGPVCVGVRRKIEYNHVLEQYPNTWVFFVACQGSKPDPKDNFELWDVPSLGRKRTILVPNNKELGFAYLEEISRLHARIITS